MLDKITLTNSLKTMLNALKSIDDQGQAIDKFSTDLADAIDAYVKSASIIATPANVVAATMSNSGGPVVAANNLTSTIQ